MSTTNSDRLLTEIERQKKYLAKLPSDYKFPLFNALQALESQRRSGYKHTAAAGREIIDNAYEAGASEAHVITETSRHTSGQEFVSSIAFIDNGPGMLPEMTRYALSWGGGTHFDDPHLIGKFGYGLPNASINQTRYTEVYTRTSGQKDITKVELNLNDFKDFGLQSVPEPVPVSNQDLPQFVQRYLKQNNIKFDCGTIVVWKRPDNLTFRRPASLKEHLEDDFGVVYRYFLAQTDRKFSIVLNGKPIAPVDPLFLHPWGRYFIPEEQGGAQLQYQATIPMAYYEDPASGDFRVEGIDAALLERIDSREIEPFATGNAEVTISRLPLDFAGRATGIAVEHADRRLEIRKPRRGISFVRAGREIDTLEQLPNKAKDAAQGFGNWPVLQSYALHWGVEIKFDPDLDQVIGITNDKQGVRPLPDFWKVLAKEDIDKRLAAENAWQMEQRKKKSVPPVEKTDTPSPATIAAQSADKAASTRPIIPEVDRPKVAAALEQAIQEQVEKTNLPAAEIREVVEERAKRIPYEVILDDGGRNGRFFQAEFFGTAGQVRVKLNKQHPFYTVLYGSLLRALNDSKGNYEARRALEGLKILLFALAKAELTTIDDDVKAWYDQQNQHQWSPFIATAMDHLMRQMPAMEETVYGNTEAAEGEVNPNTLNVQPKMFMD